MTWEDGGPLDPPEVRELPEPDIACPECGRAGYDHWWPRAVRSGWNGACGYVLTEAAYVRWLAADAEAACDRADNDAVDRALDAREED